MISANRKIEGLTPLLDYSRLHMIDSAKPLIERLQERIRDWNVVVQHTLETPTSLLAFGTRGNQAVVLKVLRQPGDEWRCGEVLDQFHGNGMVRAYEHIEGAVLLERLDPGTSLTPIALEGRDEEATQIITEVIQLMSPSRECLSEFPTVEDWGTAFERHLLGGNDQIPKELIQQGQTLYSELCGSQQVIRLLHGDLQHYNILFDSKRGWTAIDPKGVIGEIEYELGASLRNPYEDPELLSSPKTIEKRLKRYERNLKIDFNRTLKWGFAQAVLSAIWTIEDGYALDCGSPSILLAHAMRPMLD